MIKCRKKKKGQDTADGFRVRLLGFSGLNILCYNCRIHYFTHNALRN